MRLHLKWEELKTAVDGRWLHRGSSQIVESIHTDSRTLRPDQSFWALRGGNMDGHLFFPDAMARGAAGLVGEAGRIRMHFALPEPVPVLEVPDTLKALQKLSRLHRSRFPTVCVAITGSNGKTTTKEMLKSICERAGPTCASPGNWNNHIGLPLSLLELEIKHRYGIFEMGASHKGDIRLLADLVSPQLGILTNIAPAHLEFFKDLEGVFEAKTELLQALPAQAPVVFYEEDPTLHRLHERLGKRSCSFGFSKASRMQIRPHPDGMELWFEGKRHLKLPIRGQILQLNAAAAAACATLLSISPENISSGMAAFQSISMRMEERPHPSGAILWMDAYNANPGSMRASLATFCELFPEKEKYAILGDMRELGEASPSEHERLGRELKNFPIRSYVLVGPEMQHALQGAQAEPAQTVPVDHFPEISPDCAAKIRPWLRPGKALLFKASRGMALEKLLGLL